eukprot:12404291-Karenia_brevis.AAC.1
MASPKVVSWRALKKIARYLVGVERVVWWYGWRDESAFSRVYSDSDWGGKVHLWGSMDDRGSHHQNM